MKPITRAVLALADAFHDANPAGGADMVLSVSSEWYLALGEECGCVPPQGVEPRELVVYGPHGSVRVRRVAPIYE